MCKMREENVWPEDSGLCKPSVPHPEIKGTARIHAAEVRAKPYDLPEQTLRKYSMNEAGWNRYSLSAGKSSRRSASPWRDTGA